MHVQILVLDFGSQYTQLIARRLREYGVYTEIVPYFEKLDSIRAKNPKGIILSGGPASVYEKDAYKPDSAIFALGIPILGICYGMQLIAQHFGGRVIKADAQEFGKAILEILEPQSRHFVEPKDCLSDTRTILATSRTILREYSQQDFKTLCEILGDSQTMYAWGQGFEACETQEWLDKQIKSYQQNGFGIWAIIDKKSGKIIGNVGLNNTTVHVHKTSHEQSQNVIEIAYLLRHDFWGKGYAMECAHACIEYAFTTLRLEKVYCFVKEDNLASIKVAQRLGMKKIDECIKSYKGKELKHFIFEAQRISYDLLDKTIFQHVVKLWEGSVRSSHHFLNEQDLLSIQREVKKALQSTQHVIIAKQKKTLLGFIGVEKNYIEMLFVSPLIFGQGTGKALIKEALNRFLKDYPIIRVDCNEQNPQALGFYQHLGFEIVGKSPKDSAGRDFPIVHLEVSTDKLSSILLCNTLNYAIIPACKQDLQAILALQHTTFIDEAKRVGKMDIEPLTQNIEGIVHEFKQKLFLKCVLENGKIIGSVRGYKKNDTAYIGKLFVDAAYRKKGIGSALVETLCAMLPAKRYEIFTSEKSFENIILYQKLGFVEYKRESLQDIPVKAVFMEKFALDSSLTHVSPLFQDVKQNSIVWMSHADKVESIPQGFKELAKSGNTHYCAIADFKRKIYALQFHPEVVHSECGGQMLQNFAVGICGADTSWNMRNFAQNEIEKLRHIIYGSGNVDLQNPNFITMKEAFKEKGKAQTIENLLQIWEDSVRATQEVSEEFITHRRKEIEKDYIAKAEEILICTTTEEWLGFIAVQKNEITLLFITPQYFGKGIGKALLKEALNRHLYKFENIRLHSREQALGFYQSLGFKKAGKPLCIWKFENYMLTPLEVAREDLRRVLESPKDSLSFNTLAESLKQVGKTQAIQHLVSIWEQGARATHNDLNEDETAGMKEEIQEAVSKSKNLLIAQKNGEWLGFIAVEKNEITMLFVAPSAFKSGVGKALLKEAFLRYLGTFEVIRVNSLEWALGFYQHLGFAKTGEKSIPAGSAGTFSPELIPLNITRESLQKSLGIEAQGECERVRCAWATDKDEAACKLYENYHDCEWGVPLHEDKKLFEFLILEGFQAGLSWITILKKRESFRVAFDDFDYHKIAAYDESKIESLMQNEGIIRNRAKIESAITNAKAFMAVQREFGSFDKYIWGFVGGKPIINAFESIADLPASTPLSDIIAKDLKKRGFKFVGSTTMYAFMQAIGIVNDHLASCFKRHSTLGNHSADFGDFEGSHKIAKETTSKVLCAVSGGVDSSVVAALLYRAIGGDLIPVFVDTGLLRKGEREAVEKMFRENLKVPLITADASALFLSRLKGVIEPEKKRKIIGETFIEVFEKEAKKHNTKGEIRFLAQGTLYPDVIESVSVKGPSKTIKSHHNVGGLPEWMKFELIEPLRELFKDEVRALGRELGMPESMLMRHPFPGPGLAIRIMGEVNKADLNLLREADSIFIDELRKQGYYDKVWQAFCVLLNVRSVGVMGDNRTYDNTICVRAVEAIDGMTATFAHLPHDFLESVSNRIINEVEGINRVVYDVTSKPPGTIEWE